MYFSSKLIKYALGLGMMFLCIAWVHPFFVGISHVRINSKQTEVQVEVRLFTDDFQSAVKPLGLNFNPRKHDSISMVKVQDLMNKYISLWSKGKDNHWVKVPLSLVGYEEESEATWFFLESDQLPSKTMKWKFQNTWLMKEHPEQMHIVHAEIGTDYRKSEPLNVKKTEFEF